MEAFDILRSFVRGASDRTRSLISAVGPVPAIRESLRDFVVGRIAIQDAVLTAGIARAPDVTQASVFSRPGFLVLDANFDQAPRLSLTLKPEATVFAPRGAKEIHWKVSPTEMLSHPRFSDSTGELAGIIAHSLWGLLLQADHAAWQGALIEAKAEKAGEKTGETTGEARGNLCMDLRSIRAVRQGLDRNFALWIELFSLEALRCEEGRVVLQLKLPRLHESH